VPAPVVAVEPPPGARVHETTAIEPGAMPPPPAAAEPAPPRSVEQHLDEILSAVPQPDPIELAVLDAQGLLCAEEVVSQRALPAFDQAALDGYAARAMDVEGATPASRPRLSVVGETVAGPTGPASIGPGMAQKVAAGAMLPPARTSSCPAVWTDGGMASVAVHAGPEAGSYVRRTGDDVAPAPPRCRSGTPIGPAQISLLAAVGRDRVQVRPRPRVAVLSAGQRAGRHQHVPGPGRSSTSTATRWPPRRATPGPRPTAGASCPPSGAGCPRCWRASCCAATWCSIAGHLRQRGRHGAGGARRARPDAVLAGDDAPRAPAGLRAARAGTPVPVICVPGEPVAALVAFEVFVRPAIR
jgi:molybdopterin molybdotransferase